MKCYIEHPNITGKSLLFIVYMIFIVHMQIFAVSRVTHNATVKSYSIQDGLSGNGVTVIFQDSKGFIWIGTRDGLNKFDGYNFTVYRHEVNDVNSISGNYIQSICEDPEGNMWIGTIGDGLNKWNRITGKFTTYRSISSSITFPEDNIYGLSVDKDSTLWIKTDNYIINFNIHQKFVKVSEVYSTVFKPQAKITIPLFQKSSKYLWVGTKEGLIQFNKVDNLSERIAIDRPLGFTSNQFGGIYDILQIADKSYMLSGEKGVYQLVQNEYNSYICSKINLGSEINSGVSALLKHSSGVIWIGTKEGLRKMNCSSTSNVPGFDKESFYNQSENLITDKEVTCLIEDSSGLLWVGTKYDGLLKVDLKPKKFNSLSEANRNFEGLQNYNISSIHVDNKDKIWLGTSTKGIQILDLEMGTMYAYPVNLSLYRKGMDQVLSMCEDSKNRLWIGTGQGIYVYYKNRGTINEFSYAENGELKALLEQNKINTIVEDAKGCIWFGTQFGLYMYDGHVIESFFSDVKHGKSICSDEINSLYQDSKGILWIGTSEGVNFLDRNHSSFENFGYLRNIGDSINLLSSDCILSIAEDKNNRILLGTRSGITVYNKNLDEFGYYSHSNGLANDMINGIFCDQNSGIWLSTNKGISYIDPKNNIFNYDITDGLPDYIFNKGAVAYNNSGTIFFGGIGGVAYINPDSIKYNDYKPNVVLTSIELYHKGKKKESYRTDVKEITLKYRKSSLLKVQFAALEFTEPAKNKYKVYLEGFDDDWRTVSYENEIDFSDLPAGDYTLHVKGANNDFVWSEDQIELNISVVPPIWMSNYAYAFYIIALIFFVQLIINYRIRNYKSAYKTLEEKAVNKKKIEAQRELLSKINRSLTDSIYYAKRIQDSILPSENRLKQSLPDSFVYFRPKDVVSGDFYWVHEEDDILYVAAVDCTGHGVPGAFLSIIGYDMLKSIVSIGGEKCPALILDKLSAEVIKTFRKDIDDVEYNKHSVNDGMDIGLCVIDKKKRKISFAGAYNPLYLVRNNEVFVYKGDRFPIGYKVDGLNFSKHEIAIEPNDTIYIFSDGYADQFGGGEGKKFKYRRFRHLLLNIHKLPADDQKAILHQKLEDWMGNFEQVDDIIVIGMKPIVELV